MNQNGPNEIKRMPRVVVAAVDVSLVLVGIYAAFYIRFSGAIPPLNYSAFTKLVPWLVVLSLVIFTGLGLYNRGLAGFPPTVRALGTGVVLVALATAAASYWFREFAFPRAILIIAGCFQFMLLIGWRWIVWRVNRKLHGQKQLLVLGSRVDTETFLGKLTGMPRFAFKVAYILPPEQVGSIRQYLKDVHGLVVMPSISSDIRLRAVAIASELHREVYLVPSLYEVMLGSAWVGQFDDVPVLRLEGFRLSWIQSVTKRVIDVAISMFGLVFGMPVLVMAFILIRVTSPGPVLYVQQRVGLNGNPFKVYKLRTMVVDAEEKTGPILASANDPRVTRVGRFLRATRLDELPQFFNVLKGDMSIVGPRPERPQFVEKYVAENPGYRYRHFVRPGLTGLAQVNGCYDTTPEDKLRYDLHYIRNYSVFLDFQIILQTIPVMLSPSSSKSRQVNTVYDGVLTADASDQLNAESSRTRRAIY